MVKSRQLTHCHFRPAAARSRHPTGDFGDVDYDLMDPKDYLQFNKNGNTKRNIDVAVRTYNRVMEQLSLKSGEAYESLQDAPVERLPHLLMKFMQTGRKKNGERYASNTIATNLNQLSTFLANREQDQVNIKIDP